MQNITRLAVVVALLVSGTGWTVAAYLDCLHRAPDALPGALVTDHAEADEPQPAPTPRGTVVLSVDPTQDAIVSLR